MPHSDSKKARDRSLSCRSATCDDYPALLQIFQEIHQHHLAGGGEHFWKPKNSEPFRKRLDEVMADERGTILVAQSSAGIVGFAIMFLSPSTSSPLMVRTPTVLIDTIGVLSQYRRQGIGRFLMNEVTRWARQRGLAEIRLDVWAFNRTAMNFYEKLGYQTLVSRMALRLSPESS